MTQEIPKSFGRYQIESMIGEGAMGVVYKAYDPVIKRSVALKTLRRELRGGDSDELLARFKVEAEAAGRLIHPKIAAVYEFAESEGILFIVMEFASGQTLESCIRNKTRFAFKSAISILLQLLDALDFAHAHDVVHRDIKPGNILITLDGKIKVTDFGIARLEASNLTTAGEVMGTPSYMSPEQWQGLPLDRRTDIFAAGVILYQLLTGEKPFAGDTTNAIMYKALRTEPPPPTQLNAQLPPAIDAIVQKAIAKRPGDRFQTALEFLEALRHVADKPAVDQNNSTVMIPASRDKLTEMIPAGSDKRKGRRYWLAVGGIAAGAVLTVSGVLWSIRPVVGRVGFVNLASEPAGAIVLLDNGQLLGVTPTRVELPPGEYQILVKKDGYHELSASIDVQPAAEIPVTVTLNKIKPGEN